MKTFLAFIALLLLGALSASVLAMPCPQRHPMPTEALDGTPHEVPLHLADAGRKPTFA